MSVTAKIKVQSKTNEHSPESYQITFAPDYQDGRNVEWSKYTPALNLSMVIKNEVAVNFEVGQSYTLTFDLED
jgi:hypothetical protein